MSDYHIDLIIRGLLNPITLLFLTLLLGGLGSGLATLISQWMKDRRAVQLEEQKTRRIEALAKMDETGRQRLLETMPEWLDPDDPGDIEAWKQARRETIKVGRN